MKLGTIEGIKVSCTKSKKGRYSCKTVKKGTKVAKGKYRGTVRSLSARKCKGGKVRLGRKCVTKASLTPAQRNALTVLNKKMSAAMKKSVAKTHLVIPT
jgi:hypothetical protein